MGQLSTSYLSRKYELTFHTPYKLDLLLLCVVFLASTMARNFQEAPPLLKLFYAIQHEGYCLFDLTMKIIS